jgi:hypothetical protein
VVVPVRIDRGETKQRLDLTLPPALAPIQTLDPPQIDGADQIGLVGFAAARGTRAVVTARVLATIAESTIQPPVRLVTGEFPGAQYAPQWRQDLMIAITDEGPIEIDFETTETLQLVRGTTQPIPLRLNRRAGGDGPVKLSLMTSLQPIYKKQDDQQVIDRDRTLRLAEEVVIPAGTEAAEIKLATPADLAPPTVSLAIRAELLSADQQQVLAKAYTRVTRCTATDRLTVNSASSP